MEKLEIFRQKNMLLFEFFEMLDVNMISRIEIIFLWYMFC